MFESLLEKILNKFLGDFIEGFDASNLHIGIWSGEVTISNVALKADVVKMLELPIGIKFSHIGKLRLQVPWKSLASSPIEVYLSDLYIIVSAEHPDDWKFQDFAGFKKKLELLEKFKEQIVQKILDKSKPKDDKEAGYLQKLTLKVIDNIQLSIQNIHIRFEDAIRTEFSWGISLKSIEVFTTDQNWKKKFFDRTKEENKKVPLQKLLTLTNVGAYWMQQEIHFLHKLPKEEVIKEMEKLIIQTADPKEHPYYAQFILMISAEAKLIQNTSGKFDQPEFNFNIALQTIDLALENLQLQQIIRMAEMFSLYQNRLTKKKKQTLMLSNDQIEQQKAIFLTYYEKILRSPDQSIKALNKDEAQLYEQAVSNLDIEILCAEAKAIIKQVQKEEAIKQAEENKKKGWFGGSSWFGGKKKDDDLVDENERQQLVAFIDELADTSDVKDVKRPADYVWLLLNFSLQSGSVHVMKQFEHKREGVKLGYAEFIGQVQVMDSSMLVQLGLQHIAVDLVTEPIIEGMIMLKDQKKVPFLQPTSGQKLLDFQFETNPTHHKGVDKYIKLRTSSVKVTFNPLLTVRVQQFLDFQVTDETLKNAAWDQVEAAQDIAANSVQNAQQSPSILFLDIQLQAPVVVIPIQQAREAWLLNLGEIIVCTPKIDDVTYDHFQVNLKDLTFRHFQSEQECHDAITQNGHLQKSKSNYSVIENFQVEIVAQVLRGTAQAPDSTPQVQVNGVLPKLELFISPLIYDRILKIGDCFAEPDKDPDEVQRTVTRLSVEKAQTDRQTLMESATLVCKIWKRSALKTWEQFTGVLSGGYMYLFATPKDQQPSSAIWVRNSDFINVSQEDCGMPNAFIIKTKYAETIVGSDKPSFSTRWKDAIEALRTQPRVEQKKGKDGKEIQQQQKKVDRPMQFGFQVKGFQLHLQDKLNIDWLNVGIEGLGVQAEMLSGSIDLVLKLTDLYVKDSLQKYENPLLYYVVKSEPFKESSELITIRVQQLNEKDPRYKKVNLSVEVRFGTLEVILKPVVVAQLLVFVTPKDAGDTLVVSDEKKQRDQAKKAIEEQAAQQQTKLDTMQDVIFMYIDVRIESIKATLVHRFTTLPLAELNIRQTSIELSKYIDEMHLVGSLGNLQLIDLTNHPNTLSEEKDYVLIQPKEMIGVKSAQESLLKIDLRLFTDGSNKIKDNVTIIINVEMSQLIINFMMQPVMRLLDFTLQQLLFALANPQMALDPNHNQQKEETFKERKSQKNTTILLNKDEQEFLEKQLNNPPAMQIHVQINNPQVILKPNHQSKDALIIDLGNIIVTNQRIKVTDRVKDNELPTGVWVDLFLINMHDICLFQMINDTKREFSLPFDFNVCVQLFGMAQQYQIHYPQYSFDSQMKIHTYMAPMILQMTHKDYMFLMKSLFHNIAYDDGFDTMIRAKYPDHFRAFFEQQKAQELLLKERLEAGDDSPALSFQLDMENLTLFLLQDSAPKPTPFLRMMLVMMRVSFQKCNNGDAKVGLLIREMEGSVFTKQGEEFLELPFIGPMNLNQSYSYEQVVNLNGLVNGRQQGGSKVGTSLAMASRGMLTQAGHRGKIFKFEDTQNMHEEHPQYKLNLMLQMQLSGDKCISIDLADFKLMLHAGPLFQVLGLIAMDDPELTPPPGKFHVEMAKTAVAAPPQPAGGLTVRVGLRNVINCIPSNVESNVLAVRGVFSIELIMRPVLSVEEVKTIVEARHLDEPDFADLNRTMMLDAKLMQLEICLCKSYDLAKKDDFALVKKRAILHPINLSAKLTKALVISKDLYAFKDTTNIEVLLSHTNLKVSFKDVNVIQSGLNYQLAQMPKAAEVAPVEVKVEQKTTNEIDLSKINQIQLIEMNIKAEIEGTKVVILNDMGNTFTPLMDFEMDSIKCILKKNNIFQTIALNVPFKLSYYNPRASRWEPVIEKVVFQIDLYNSMISQLGNGSIITVEQTEQFDQFNITLSTMFIQTVFRALMLVKKMFAPPEEQQHQQQVVQNRSVSNDADIFQSVSPYVVRNMTGYPIIVEPKVEGLPGLQLASNQQHNIRLTDELEIKETGPAKKVKVIIKLPRNELVIKEIDMDRIKTKMYISEEIPIYTNLKLDNITNSKVLIVGSPVVFVNFTNQNVIITMSDKHNTSTVKLTKHTSERDLTHLAPLPLAYVNPRFSMRFESCEQFCDEMNVDKLIKGEKLVQEVQTRDGQYVILNVQLDPESKHRFKIHIEAPFRITNSLPKDMYIQLLSDQKETIETRRLKPMESMQNYSLSHHKRTYLRVLVSGFYWSDEYKLYPGQNDASTMGQLTMYDADERKLSLLMFEPWRLPTYNRATREFIVHCSGYIINQSKFKLIYSTVNEKKKTSSLVPGQESINVGDHFDSNIILIGPESGQLLELTDKSAKDQKSQNPAPIATIGEPQFDVLVRDEHDKLQQVFMGAQIYLKVCNNQHTLFNKIIVIEPRFILVNQCSRNLLFRAANTQSDQLLVECDTRIPYRKPYDADAKVGPMLVNLKFHEQEYQWSGDLDISAIGIVYFQLRKGDERAYFSCDTRQEGCNIFVIIKDIPKEQAPYKIMFTVPNMDLKVPAIPASLNQQQQAAYYAWDDPGQASKVLEVELAVTGEDAAQYKKFQYKLYPDHIGLFKVYYFRPPKGSKLPSIPIALNILPNGYQKVILVELATPEQIKLFRIKPKQDFLKQQKQDIDGDEDDDTRSASQSLSRQSSVTTEDKIENRMNVKLANFTLSLVHNSDPKKRPAEYILISLRDMEFVQIATDLYQAIQLRIQFFNIDHNSQFFVNYPVILTPVKYALYQKQKPDAKQQTAPEKYFLNVMIVKDAKVKDINLFQRIVFEMDPFAIKVEDLLINALMEYVGAITAFQAKMEEFEKQQREKQAIEQGIERKSFESEQQVEDAPQDLKWLNQELPAPSLPTYISEITISPINIQLTFQMQSKTSDLKTDDMALFKSIAQALGVVLSNIDEAPLTFHGLQLDNCFDTVAGITNKMISFYKNEAISQLLKLVASLSVIGNPVGLFNNVSTGVKDLFERPAQGFTQGPLEGGLGLVQGAGSLVSHTIAGAFNSVNKITGSIGSGLTSLTMDEDYIREREKMRLQKPKHLGDGIEQGAKSVYQGFSKGITGVFLKPFEGAKAGGIKGFFKGTVQGVTGLVIKPVAGILDAAAKTAEGIKNTVSYFDDKPNESRLRNIRPIYGFEGYYTDYVDLDAEALTILFLIKKGQMMDNRFVAAFMIVPDPSEQENKFLLVLTMENIVYMSFKTKKKVWIIPVSEFANVDKIPLGIKIGVKKPLKQLKDKKETQVILDNEAKEVVYKQIVNLIDMVQYLG